MVSTKKKVKTVSTKKKVKTVSTKKNSLYKKLVAALLLSGTLGVGITGKIEYDRSKKK